MIPHMSHLDGNHDRAAQQLFHRKHCSFLTQPPLISVAFLSVHQKAPRKAILRAVFPKLLAYHDWFDRRRDPDKAGTAIADIESLRELESRRRKLAGLIETHDCDAAVLSGIPGGFFVEPVDFNSIRVADLEALSMIAMELGEYGESSQLGKRAGRTRRAIQDRMITESGGVLQAHDLIGKERKQSKVNHAGKFVLLFGHCLSTGQARSLAADLSDPRSGYATAFPVPSVPTLDPTFDGDEYWRGNVWLSINWLIHKGLLNYGMVDEARLLAKQSHELVSLAGFQEFFNPHTGKGGMKYGKPCPRNYGWSTIILDMMLGSCP